MKLIVGLGNPGLSYANSRHNIGFQVLKNLAKDLKLAFKRDGSTSSFLAKTKLGSVDVILALPLTYMNLSGSAVKKLLNRYHLETDSLLVVSDDLDLELGRLKIKKGGSAGGHNGIQSIIESIGTSDFARIRIGIGRPNIEASDFVLSNFKRQEIPFVKEAIEQAVACCKVWVVQDTSKCMNIFNKRDRKEIEK